MGHETLIKRCGTSKQKTAHGNTAKACILVSGLTHVCPAILNHVNYPHEMRAQSRRC